MRKWVWYLLALIPFVGIYGYFKFRKEDPVFASNLLAIALLSLILNIALP